MKPIFLVVLSLLLATGARAQTQDPVLDADGKPVRKGSQYYVLPSIWANGGGLRVFPVNGTCPPHVTQLSSEVQNGQPVTFFPDDSSEGGVVRLGSKIYIRFARPSARCPQSSTLWKMDEGYITTGGTVSSRDPHDSRFAIYKSGSLYPGYVIQFCPCKRCRIACSNVVVNLVNGRRLLTVGEGTYEVVFAKLKQEEGEYPTANIILPATIRPDDE